MCQASATHQEVLQNHLGEEKSCLCPLFGCRLSTLSCPLAFPSACVKVLCAAMLGAGSYLSFFPVGDVVRLRHPRCSYTKWVEKYATKVWRTGMDETGHSVHC